MNGEQIGDMIESELEALQIDQNFEELREILEGGLQGVELNYQSSLFH